MHPATPDDLAHAFEIAAGIRTANDPALDDPLVRYAYGVVSARRAEAAAEPCPADVKARVEGLYVGRPRGKVGALLALVFDSATAPAAPVRGVARTTRTLRFSGSGATVDLQVRRTPEGDRRLYVAVRPPVPGMTFEIRGMPHGGARHVVLDATGVGEVTLPWRAPFASAACRVEGGETFRIESIDLR